jgi:signal peptidase II
MREPATRFAVSKWLALAAAVILLDHLSKWWVSTHLEPDAFVPVLPFFSLVLVHNTGAAFSFLANAGGWPRWFFIAVGVIATVIIVHLLRRHAHEPRLALPLALVLGGALGNVIDRAVFGHVVDFLYFHYRGFAWPAFNVADSAITIGAVLLVWDGLAGKPAASKIDHG